MGTESRERAEVSNAYDGKDWKRRVKNMPDNQITAIYLRLKAQGRIK